MPLQKKLFTKGINSDLSNEFMPDGSDRYRLNVRVMTAEGANLGAIETMNGNTLVTFTLPSGTNTCIGAKEYLIGRKIYYFIHNSTAANCCILEYNEVSGSVGKVLQSDVLKFNSGKLITGINIIELDANNHLLYWTDGNVRPRKINIEKGKYHMAANYTLGYPTPFVEEFICRIKYPMPTSPITVYSDDITAKVNHLDKKLFQFQVQNVFDDKEVSAFSPISKTVYPLSAVVNGGNNVIRVTFNTGSEIVKKIRVYVKEVNSVGFSLVTELDKDILGIASNSTYTYLFYNDGSYFATETQSSIKLFDSVPKLSQSQELVYGNRITDGLITEGFDAVPIDLKLSYTQVSDAVAPGAGTVSGYTITSYGGAYSAGNYGPTNAPITGGGGALATATVQVTLTYDGYGNPDTQTIVIVITNPGAGYTSTPVIDLTGVVDVYGAPIGLTAVLIVGNNVLPIPVNALKRGGSYTVGAIYFNEGNQSGVTNINEGAWNEVNPVSGKYGTSLFIPFYTEVDTTKTTIAYNTASGVFNTGDIIVGSATGATGVIISSGASPIVVYVTDGNFVSEVQISNQLGVTATFLTAYQTTLSGGAQPIINWRLFNEPPSWATRYQLARVKNSANDRYLQFLANDIKYLDKNGAGGYAWNDPLVTQMKVVISPIMSDFLNANPGSLLHYDYEKGDRIRFIKDASKAFYTQYIDFEIALYEAPSMEVRVRFPEGYTPINFTSTGGQWFEIYQPGLVIPVNNKITYEIGECGTVGYDAVHSKYYHSGSVQNQSYWTFNASSATGAFLTLSGATAHGLALGAEIRIAQTVNTNSYNDYAIVTEIISATSIKTNKKWISAATGGNVVIPANGVFTAGDTFYRPRVMPFAGNTSSYTYIIEDANYSDFFVSPGYDYGRPNRIDPDYREIVRPSTVYWSEAFIPETNINGLSSVFDTSFQTYEAKYGGIYKLYAEDQRVYVYQELKIGGILVEQIIIDSGQGNSIVGVSSDVLSVKIEYLQGEIGIGKHPESFAVYNKAKYGIDVLRGVIWRQALDGVIPISDMASMHNFTADQCKKMLRLSQKLNVYGVFDVRFGEYVIAFQAFKIENVTVDAVTLAFNEKTNEFSTFYSYVPEMMCQRGIDIVSFKTGAMWTHNSNAVQANFYGVSYMAEFWSIMNMLPSNEKILEAISQETNSAWEVYDISTPNGQQSNLVVSDFAEINNLQYAAILRDTNTPNIVAPALALFEGDVLIDTNFLAKFRYTLTTFTRILAVNFKYIVSNLSNR